MESTNITSSTSIDSYQSAACGYSEDIIKLCYELAFVELQPVLMFQNINVVSPPTQLISAWTLFKSAALK
jgi:hypothetical protein